MEQLKNRGKESSDDKLFGTQKVQALLKEAVIDLSHLLSRGYGVKSSMELVGNRYRLNVRQQKAVVGMGASDEQVIFRNRNSLKVNVLRNEELVIDGFNVIILIESMLSGAYLFKGRDGFYRDLSSVHGSYKRVLQTGKAIEIIGEFFRSNKLKKLHWFFDKPVSNSGRLKKMIEEYAESKGYDWEATLTYSPDKDLVASDKIIVSSDAWVLDHASKNFNLLAFLIQKQ